MRLRVEKVFSDDSFELMYASVRHAREFLLVKNNIIYINQKPE